MNNAKIINKVKMLRGYYNNWEIKLGLLGSLTSDILIEKVYL